MKKEQSLPQIDLKQYEKAKIKKKLGWWSGLSSRIPA
jgi:hypothetical protein